MIGAIAGDFIGSRWERACEFIGGCTDLHIPELLHKSCFFTDDTVLTIATADILCNSLNPAQTYREYIKRYSHLHFSEWHRNWAFDEGMPLRDEATISPAMRISPAAYATSEALECAAKARYLSIATHANERAIQAATVVAHCVQVARKTNIPELVNSVFCHYDNLIVNLKHINASIFEDIEPDCDLITSLALYFALNTETFDECMRACIFSKVDVDTVCSIAAAVFGELHGIPREVEYHVLAMLKRKHPELHRTFIDCCDKLASMQHQHRSP